MQNLTASLEREIIDIARNCGVKRLILFGSRARGDCHDLSDIDLAILGGDALRFKFFLDEHAHTLLKFDVLDLATIKNTSLLRAIATDGVILYDQT